MRIYNNEKFISNKQLESLLGLYNENYTLNKIIIINKKYELIKMIYQSNILIAIKTYLFKYVWNGKLCGYFIPEYNLICMFVFNIDKTDTESKKEGFVFYLYHELRHYWQKVNNMELSEEDADMFATNFINDKSEQIDIIMNLNDK